MCQGRGWWPGIVAPLVSAPCFVDVFLCPCPLGFLELPIGMGALVPGVSGWVGAFPHTLLRGSVRSSHCTKGQCEINQSSLLDLTLPLSTV